MRNIISALTAILFSTVAIAQSGLIVGEKAPDFTRKMVIS
ncbi:hypothetical protein FHS68_003788 [Dyadobacter arcticus]|uniref:Uncharacterized protein n=1 Tax=Dyadobacter arcticus TaxID=1078754 RepID=A0ABX0UUK0_9BACT|nr:hypothetical protein [Dyadobacter arcticus]